MARTPRLGATVAALTLAVLLAHWATLAWLVSRWQEPSVLRPLATPMLTRQIVPSAPPPQPIPKKKVATAHIRRAQSAINSIAIESIPTQQPSTITPPPAVADAAPDAATSTASTSPAAEAPASAPVGTSSIATLDSTETPASSTNYLDIWPADTRLTYRLGGQYRGELHGDAQVLWQREAEQYQARIEVDIGWLVSMKLTSQGTITPQGLFPRAYEESVRSVRRSIGLDEQSIALANGNIVARPDGVQDTVSQFVELAYQFTTGRAALEVGRSVNVWLARPGGVDLWTYDVLEEVTLPTPRLGPVQAFHVKPRPISSPRGNIMVEMWFAPSLQYLPVRIRINLGEAIFVDLIVDKIEQR